MTEAEVGAPKSEEEAGLSPPQIRLSLDGGTAQQVPSWMRWMLDAGFQWSCKEGPTTGRRVVLVSLPTDSPSAGLFALGALVGQMTRPDANVIHAHFQNLLTSAKQYIHHCQKCKASCRPARVGCGFLSRVGGQIRSVSGVGSASRLFDICEVGLDPERGQFIKVRSRGNSSGSSTLFERAAFDYRIPEQPPWLVGTVAGALGRLPYQAIFPGAEILGPNLASSHSGVCFAGRPAGTVATRIQLDSVGFSIGERVFPLSELLTVTEWAPPRTVSRMTYFSTGRTLRLDRQGPSPAVVVADGGASFLEVLSRSDFSASDVVGVVHRCVDRAALEELWKQLDGLRQWYRAEPIDAWIQRQLPIGCTGIVLCRDA